MEINRQHVVTFLFLLHQRYVQETDRILVLKTTRLYLIQRTVPFPDVPIALDTTPIVHDRVATIGEHGTEPAEVKVICLFQLFTRNSPAHRLGA